MYGPKPARNFSTRAGGSGAPPEEMLTKDEKCSRVTSGWAARAMKAGDGPTVEGGRCDEGGRRSGGVVGRVLGEGLQDDPRLEAVRQHEGAHAVQTGPELA